MRTFSKLTLAAGIGLAMAFTFTACMTYVAGLTETQAQKERRLEESREHQRKYEATYDSLRAIYDRDTIVMMTIGDKAYKTVMIGTTVWMAENLNMEIGNSVCYENKEENCDRCGRLYDYETAMKACPSGWHLGSYTWQDTPSSTSPKKITGAELKAKSGWNNNGNGEDKYGFSALPCGALYVNSSAGQQAAYAKEKAGGGNTADAVTNLLVAANKPRFSGYGSSASFWYGNNSVSPDKRYYKELNSNSNQLEGKYGDVYSMFSVRCIKGY